VPKNVVRATIAAIHVLQMWGGGSKDPNPVDHSEATWEWLDDIGYGRDGYREHLPGPREARKELVARHGKQDADEEAVVRHGSAGGQATSATETPGGGEERLSRTREELAKIVAERLLDIYNSTPPVDKEDEKLDQASWTEFVLQIADVDRWFDSSGEHDCPRAGDIYDRLRISSKIKRIGVTNIRSTFHLTIEAFSSRKTENGWRTPRTKYDVHRSVEKMWSAAKELGIDFPAKLARMAGEAVGKESPSGRSAEEKDAARRILSFADSWPARIRNLDSVDTGLWEALPQVLHIYRQGGKPSRRKAYASAYYSSSFSFFSFLFFLKTSIWICDPPRSRP
jgi:hypothetical protein